MVFALLSINPSRPLLMIKKKNVNFIVKTGPQPSENQVEGTSGYQLTEAHGRTHHHCCDVTGTNEQIRKSSCESDHKNISFTQISMHI